MIEISFVTAVDSDRAFRFHNGKIAYSISDLSQIIEAVDDDTFSYHMNSQKNDFANWAEYVFDEKTLATELRLCKTKEEILNMIDIAVHGEIAKTLEKKELHIKESRDEREREQKELKERLEQLKLQLKEKLEKKEEAENIEKSEISGRDDPVKKKLSEEKKAEKTLDFLPAKNHSEYLELEYKPDYKARRNFLKDYAVLWMIMCFIIGIILGVIITRSIV